MTEDAFVIDMSKVDEGGDFAAAPIGWYQCLVNGYSTEKQNGDPIQVNKEGGKLPKGTRGTQWEFTVVEGEYSGRKVWTTYWHHANTAGFWKTLFRASGAFTDEELESPDMDILNERERVVGSELWVRFGKQTYEGNEQNTVKALKHLDEREAPVETPDESSLFGG